MSVYQTDDEQVESIKKWWKENGKSVIGGVVLGFAGIAGWQTWQGYQGSQAENASVYFDALQQSVRTGQYDKADEDGRRLIGEFGSTAYASFAALQLAKLAYQRGEKATARGHLRWVSESAPDPALRELGRLRLARLLLDLDELDALEALLQGPFTGAMAGEFAALRGDLEHKRGNSAAAREAYQKALIRGVEDESLLRMKLVDVGDRSDAG